MKIGNIKLFVILLTAFSSFFALPVYADEAENLKSSGIEITVSCDAIFTPEAIEIINEVLAWFRILAPIVLILLIAVDFAKAMMAHDSDMQKKAYSNSVKRILAAIGLFLVPTFVTLLLGLDGVREIMVSDPLCTNAKGTTAKAYEAIASAVPEDTQVSSPKNNPYLIHLSDIKVTTPVVQSNPIIGAGGKGYSRTVTIAGKTCKVYKQGKYKAYRFWGGTISSHGCGPTSAAIVLSCYGKNVTPVDTSKKMSYGSLNQVRKAIQAFGVKTSSPRTVSSRNISSSIAEIRAHLATGRPVVVLVGKSKTHSPKSKYTGGGHFMVLLGERNGSLIIANPSNSSESGTLEDLVRYYMANTTRSSRGYLLVTS